MEGLEVEDNDIPIRSGDIVRLGPLNVPVELKDIIEDMAEKDMRSISNTCRLLIERGLKYTEEKRQRP